MRGSRVLCIAGLTAAIALAVTGAAYACNEPVVGVYPTQARPGDTVTVTVTNTTPGAQYTIGVEGQGVIDSGVDADGGGLTTRFTMPAQRDGVSAVSVNATVTHSDIANDNADGGGTWVTTTRVSYPAPAESEQASGSGAAAPAPAAQTTNAPAPSTGAGQPNRQGSPTGAGGSRPSHRTVDRKRAATPATRIAAPHRRTSTAQTRATLPGVSVPAPPTIRAAIAPADTGPASRPHTREEGYRAHGPAPATARNRHAGPQVGDQGFTVTLRTVRTRHRTPAIPLAGALLGVLLAVLLGRGLAGIAMRRRAPDRVPPTPARRAAPLADDHWQALAVEAELQEIIAEARARDDERVRGGPRARARA